MLSQSTEAVTFEGHSVQDLGAASGENPDTRGRLEGVILVNNYIYYPTAHQLKDHFGPLRNLMFPPGHPQTILLEPIFTIIVFR